MNVLVFRNRFGPVAVWLLPQDEAGLDAPERAVLHVPGVPLDPRIQNMDSKGSDGDWLDWANYLASQPLLGSWSVQEAPDGLSPEAVLDAARRADTAKAALGS